jgi:hypothetical protein
MDLGVDFLTAKIVGEVDAVEVDPVKGAGVELLWLTVKCSGGKQPRTQHQRLSTVCCHAVLAIRRRPALNSINSLISLNR